METIKCKKIIFPGIRDYKVVGYNFYYIPPHHIMYDTVLLPTDISSDFYINMPEDYAMNIIIKNENYKMTTKVLEKDENWKLYKPYIYATSEEEYRK